MSNTLKIIIDMIKGANAAPQIVKDLKGLEEGGEKAAKSAKDLEKNMKLVNASALALAGAAAAAVMEVINWGGAIDELSRITGQGVEETSKLAIVMGDIGISTDTLKLASKSLKEVGLVPTLDTIKELAKQYQAIEDPVERNKWGAKTLGRAYIDLSEALSKTPEELDALGKAAESSGRIMTDETIAAAEKLEENLKQLQDQAKGLQVTFGNAVIPSLIDATQAVGSMDKGVRAVIVSTLLYNGVISQEQAALRLAAIAAGESVSVYENLSPAVEEAAVATVALTDEQIALNVQTAALNSTWQGYPPTVSAAVVANEAYRVAVEPLIGAVSDLSFGMGELTTATIFNAAAQGLDSEAAYALAVGMGLVDEKTAGVKQQLDDAREKFDENRDGMISAAEAANGYADAVMRISGVLQDAVSQQNQLNALANAMPGGAGGGIVAGGSGGFAEGANFTVPPGFPNDSYPMRVESGEHVTVTPAGQQAGGGMTVNNYVTINDQLAAKLFMEEQRRREMVELDRAM